MLQDDIRTLSEMERDRDRELRKARRKEMDAEFDEASHSETFSVFNSIIGTITVICSLVFCVYFLWKNSKPLLGIVIVMVIVSFVCKRLARHYYFKGDTKKFERYNRLSGIAGVATSMFELADLRDSKSRGALIKLKKLRSPSGLQLSLLQNLSSTEVPT